MAFAEDLTPFFNTADFAMSAVWNGLNAVTVIFDAAYLEAIDGVAEGYGPAAWVETATMPTVAHGDTLEVNGTTYVVRGVQPDGTGVTLLRLEEQ